MIAAYRMFLFAGTRWESLYGFWWEAIWSKFIISANRAYRRQHTLLTDLWCSRRTLPDMKWSLSDKIFSHRAIWRLSNTTAGPSMRDRSLTSHPFRIQYGHNSYLCTVRRASGRIGHFRSASRDRRQSKFRWSTPSRSIRWHLARKEIDKRK